ncbi:MAG: type II toxin-antitoxin system RatA family toxin [Oligoflexales bacterium]
MPSVCVEHHIQAHIEDVWEIVSDVAGYPALMPSVNTVDVISEEGHTSLTDWNVSLRESIMCWTEEEIKDHKNFTVTFKQTEGDLADFQGQWMLRQSTEKQSTTVASLQIDFDIGIPALDDILNPIAVEALRENAHSMLSSIAACWEAA